jgi:hypothetical protein
MKLGCGGEGAKAARPHPLGPAILRAHITQNGFCVVIFYSSLYVKLKP